MEKVSESLEKLGCGELFLVWFQKAVHGCCAAAPLMHADTPQLTSEHSA